MQSWIAYSDHDARKVAGLLADRDTAGSSAKADEETCAICVLVQRAMRAVAKGVVTALHSASTHLGKVRVSTASPTTDASLAPTPEEAAGGTARPSADPHPGSIRPSLFGAKELNVRQLSIAPILERPDGGTIEHDSKQDPDSIRPDVTIDAVAEPSSRPIDTTAC